MSEASDFANFYEAYAPKVRGLLFRLVGERYLLDLTQEAFLKAWEARDKFRGESHKATWLYRIAYNCAVDHPRKKSPVTSSLGPESYDETLEGDYSNKELAQMALASLSLEHRIVAVLFYFDELSLEEISATLQIPGGTVKSRLNHARIKMNEFLKEKGVQL